MTAEWTLKMVEDKIKRFQITIPRTLYSKLDRLASDAGLRKTDVMRELIESWTSGQEKTAANEVDAVLIDEVKRVLSPILDDADLDRYINLILTAEAKAIAKACNYDAALAGKTADELPDPFMAELQAQKAIWGEFDVANGYLNYVKTRNGQRFSDAGIEAAELREKVRAILSDRFDARFARIPEMFYRAVRAAKQSGFYEPVSSNVRL